MGGHRAAANAVLQAIGDSVQTSGGPPVEPKFIDFNDSSTPERRRKREAQNFARNHDVENTRKSFHRQMHPSWLTRLVWRYLIPAAKNKDCPHAEAMVAREDPDVLLSVHMDTNAMSAVWQKHGALKGPAHCVVTDYVAHYVWATHSIARYYVASEEVKRDLARYGVPEDKVMVTGIPISPRISAPDARPAEDVKRMLGLHPERPLVLIMGGSQGDQQYAPLLKALEREGTTAQVVALCGRSEEKRKEVDGLAPTLSFPVFSRPFVDMRDYYQAADLIISKPGGLTTAEVLAKGKPMIVVSPYAGMEEMQVQRLSQAGVVKYGASVAETAALAKRLLTHDDERQALSVAARSFGRPEAASVIARDVILASRAMASTRAEYSGKFAAAA